MIKQQWVCVCDICGKIAPAKRVSDAHNDDYQNPPDGWKHGYGNKATDICPNCAKVLRLDGKQEA